MKTAATSNRPQAVIWRNRRAATESGWDFSSRWLSDGRTLATMRTLDLLPPDLNRQLAQLERTLARAYSLKRDAEKSATYTVRANLRTAAIQHLMWDAQDGVFTDYLWRQGKTTRTVTAATIVHLFLQVATPAQAQAVADTISHRLLAGLATSLIESGQQWDAPNGWAPLQWDGGGRIAQQRFRQAGRDDRNALGRNIAGCEKEAKLVENVPPLAATRAAAANTRPRSASAGPTASSWCSAISIPPASRKSTARCLPPRLRDIERPHPKCAVGRRRPDRLRD